jgi:hypothetical protein
VSRDVLLQMVERDLLESLKDGPCACPMDVRPSGEIVTKAEPRGAFTGVRSTVETTCNRCGHVELRGIQMLVSAELVI